MLTARDKPTMRKIILFSAVGMFSIANGAPAKGDIESRCIPVHRSIGQISVKLVLSGTGRYCLKEDLVQHNVFDIIDGSVRGSPGKGGVLSVLMARDLELDLRGHIATSSPFKNTTGINIQSSATGVTVKRGSVQTPGPVGIGAWIVAYKDDIFSSFAEEDVPPAYTVDGVKVNWDYKPATHHVLDFLHIRSGGRGVVLAGDSNTLQNSTVEVDGAVAVYVYGPNAVIEGNTFIVHRPRDQYVPATSAILKLRDADNAVIRNNRFIFVDAFPGHARAEVAINLLTSKNVLIESNTAEGVNTLLRKDDSTNFFEQYNILK